MIDSLVNKIFNFKMNGGTPKGIIMHILACRKLSGEAIDKACGPVYKYDGNAEFMGIKIYRTSDIHPDRIEIF